MGQPYTYGHPEGTHTRMGQAKLPIHIWAKIYAYGMEPTITITLARLFFIVHVHVVAENNEKWKKWSGLETTTTYEYLTIVSHTV